VTFSISKNGGNVGTITFAVGALQGTFSGSSSGVTFTASDQIIIQVDNSVNGQNSTFADAAVTIKGTSTS
jgi:hypothetical protein